MEIYEKIYASKRNFNNLEIIYDFGKCVYRWNNSNYVSSCSLNEFIDNMDGRKIYEMLGRERYIVINVSGSMILSINHLSIEDVADILNIADIR